MDKVANEILFSHKKEWNFAICDSTDGPREYYAKRNKLDRERLIPHDFTSMLNVKNKTNEQEKQIKKRLTYIEQTDGCQRAENGKMGQKGEEN